MDREGASGRADLVDLDVRVCVLTRVGSFFRNALRANDFTKWEMTISRDIAYINKI